MSKEKLRDSFNNSNNIDDSINKSNFDDSDPKLSNNKNLSEDINLNNEDDEFENRNIFDTFVDQKKGDGKVVFVEEEKSKILDKFIPKKKNKIKLRKYSKLLSFMMIFFLIGIFIFSYITVVKTKYFSDFFNRIFKNINTKTGNKYSKSLNINNLVPSTSVNYKLSLGNQKPMLGVDDWLRPTTEPKIDNTNLDLFTQQDFSKYQFLKFKYVGIILNQIPRGKNLLGRSLCTINQLNGKTDFHINIKNKTGSGWKYINNKIDLTSTKDRWDGYYDSTKTHYYGTNQIYDLLGGSNDPKWLKYCYVDQPYSFTYGKGMGNHTGIIIESNRPFTINFATIENAKSDDTIAQYALCPNTLKKHYTSVNFDKPGTVDVYEFWPWFTTDLQTPHVAHSEKTFTAKDIYPFYQGIWTSIIYNDPVTKEIKNGFKYQPYFSKTSPLELKNSLHELWNKVVESLMIYQLDYTSI